MKNCDLVKNIANGIRVLSTRDGYAIPEEIVLERARNIAAQLIILHGASIDEVPVEPAEAA